MVRIVVDVPEQTVRRVQALIEAGRFQDMNVFVAAAVENQIVLESEPLGSSGLAHDRAARTRRAPGIPDIQFLRAADLPPSGATATSSPAAGLTVVEAGWIWGLVNRLLPLKVAVRVLAGLTEQGPEELKDLRKTSSAAAVDLGAWLAAVDRESGHRREERLSTAFPLRNPADKSVSRFADHFVGRITSTGEIRGALFELGLAGVTSERSPSPAVALTEAGWQFARISNPVLDEGSNARGLSKEESTVYVRNAVTHIPRERDCLRTVLSALRSGPRNTKALDKDIQRHLAPKVGGAEATTLRAGALGRFDDLGLAHEERTPEGGLWTLSERGREVLAELGE